MPRTDGRHVAWVHLEADGITWNVVVNGGLRLTSDASTRPQINVNEENTFQLQRGQLLWKDTGGTPRYYAGGRLSALSILPATSFERFWLADGFIASLGTGGTGYSDRQGGVSPGRRDACRRRTARLPDGRLGRARREPGNGAMGSDRRRLLVQRLHGAAAGCHQGQLPDARRRDALHRRDHSVHGDGTGRPEGPTISS